MGALSAATLGKVGAVLVTGVVAASAVIVVTDGSGAPAAGAHAWFDEPLDDAYFESGPVHVVAHAAHPEGVVDVVVTADGDEVAVVDTGGDRLVDVELDWEPSTEGVFTLQIVGRDNDGDLTAPDTVTVGVGVEPTAEDASELAGGATTTDSTAPGDTPPPTEPGDPSSPSITDPGGPSPGAGPTVAPPSSGGPGVTPPPPPPTCPGVPEQLSTSVPRTGFAPRLQWRYLGCAPDQFEAQMSTTPTFVQGPDDQYRQGLVAGAQRYWDVTPDLVGRCTTYYWRVRARVGRDLGSWSTTQSYLTPCR
jgi:hypothetical protein